MGSYSLTVKTANDDGAGTDGFVRIVLDTLGGESKSYYPDRNFHNDFEQGSEETYPFEEDFKQPFSQIRVYCRMDHPYDPWHLDWVRVTDESTGIQYYAHFDIWFSDKLGFADRDFTATLPDPTSNASNPGLVKAKELITEKFERLLKIMDIFSNDQDSGAQMLGKFFVEVGYPEPKFFTLGGGGQASLLVNGAVEVGDVYRADNCIKGASVSRYVTLAPGIEIGAGLQTNVALGIWFTPELSDLGGWSSAWSVSAQLYAGLMISLVYRSDQSGIMSNNTEYPIGIVLSFISGASTDAGVGKSAPYTFLF